MAMTTQTKKKPATEAPEALPVDWGRAAREQLKFSLMVHMIALQEIDADSMTDSELVQFVWDMDESKVIDILIDRGVQTDGQEWWW